jgi:DNA-directed RNA polymerase specialized sigma24 family protein
MESLPLDRGKPPIKEIYRIAKQYSRREEEVDDLVQDLLLEAVRIGKDFSDASFMGWGRGFLRNRAAFIARTEGRRREREKIVSYADQEPTDTGIQLPEDFITRLRPSLRIIARLVNCGLNRKEILYLLNIADTAFRQRLTAIRREWTTYPDTSERYGECSHKSAHTLPSGLIRRSLTQAFRNTANRKGDKFNWIIGSHDPDGHLFTIRSPLAHKTKTNGNTTMDNEG